MKLCKDCKHFGFVRWDGNVCLKTSKNYTELNLVTGDKQVGQQTCSEQRHNVVAENVCGPQGRWWERKE